jgi:TRAP transporter 4TM/12TM fusion protein
VLTAACLAWALSAPQYLGYAFYTEQLLALVLGLALCVCYHALNWHGKRQSGLPLFDMLLGYIGLITCLWVMWQYPRLLLDVAFRTPEVLVISAIVIVLCLEGLRRATGWALLIVVLCFFAYAFVAHLAPVELRGRPVQPGPLAVYLAFDPSAVFGSPLVVGSTIVLMFLWMGDALVRSGGGEFFKDISMAFLGDKRAGAAKICVVGSALFGMISGSAVSNVASVGVFTIPLMKRTGYSAVKAGAIEAASSINGQLMPPVMGAAAFLMVEYVGIPYSEIIKHAVLPAVISYIALFYIVHLEALKYDLQPIPRGYEITWRRRILGWGIGTSGTIVALGAVYFVIEAVRYAFGEYAGWALGVLTVATYVGLLGYSSRYPDLPIDEPGAKIFHLPRPWPTVRAGLHFFIPIVVLLWCLMVEELSPGTSAFWATATTMALVIVQPAMLSWMRGTHAIADGVREGFATLWKGFVLGARNMIGIGVACASAGLIVGAITLTGMGLMMTDLVELISAGNVLLMLMLTAVICLLIGAGVPTTANYILVATLMAPVIVELGARSDLVIPLIAVHLFVFYFGIMADVTPPVGLASYAAAAISGADPNQTGWQATWYSFRTALLPFVFIFNPQILFIGVATWVDVVMVCISATVASLLFAAATMLWFRTKCTFVDVVVLLLATFLFFRPDYVIDWFYPKYLNVPPDRIYEVAGQLEPNEWLVVSTVGTTIEGDDVKKTVAIPMGEGKDGREKIRNSGVTLTTLGNALTISDVKFGSRARKLGVERGFKIVELKLPNPERPSHNWVFIPAALAAALVWYLQGLRMRKKQVLAKA